MNLVQALAGSQTIRSIAQRSAPARELIANYVPGRRIEDITDVLADLRTKGLSISLEYQGFHVETPDGAEVNTHGYLHLIQVLGDHGLARGAEISVRLGWLGLLLSDGERIAAECAAEITRLANEAGATVTLDMGPSSQVDQTLRIWEGLYDQWETTGVTVQANLHRSLDDVVHLARSGARIRIVKGGYNEHKSIAYRKQHDVDLSYAHLLRLVMRSKAVPLIATHDPQLIAIAEELVRRTRREYGDHEFQMMYGIRPFEQRRLVDIGHMSRVYIPIGPGWYDYYLLRLAERPASVATFLRSLVGKR